MNFLEDNNLSHANWALNDKEEGASALLLGAGVSGCWGQDQLNESGRLPQTDPAARCKPETSTTQ